eukprot:CAMPEP_0167817734 /NCGR_PEP_ID=MMETSP0112_2-20121227/4387_1 /TAXON_ID=91324 /ORGANISM="Lotharella globosa, Strain CCCM811" /LENGTH=56 /DNA_ID=CAMNT_0007717587 /DNA_START=8 /DNA_END=178 /DNA_ORIENTATION=+
MCLFIPSSWAKKDQEQTEQGKIADDRRRSRTEFVFGILTVSLMGVLLLAVNSANEL